MRKKQLHHDIGGIEPFGTILPDSNVTSSTSDAGDLNGCVG